MGLFIQIFIDAAILWAVLTLFLEMEISLGMAAALGFGTAIVTALLAWGLVGVMGPYGVYVAIVLAAILLGVALSALFGLEIKQAITAAVIFMVAHSVVWLILSKMMTVPADAAAYNANLQLMLT